MFAAAQRGDWEAAIAPFDANVEFDASRMPDGAVYRGTEDLFAFYARWFGAWRDLTFELERVVDLGDRVLVMVTLRGRGRESGAEVSIVASDLYTFDEGRIVRHVGFPDPREALKAVGLEE